MKLLSEITSPVVAARWAGKVMVKLSEVFAAAEPTAFAKAKLLPQLCASQDWTGENPEGHMPGQRGFRRRKFATEWWRSPNGARR